MRSGSLLAGYFPTAIAANNRVTLRMTLQFAAGFAARFTA
jgi:hypothetical protein